MTTTHLLKTNEAEVAYDLDGLLPTPDGRPPLLMIGQPMTASGFGALASQFPDRTVITYDPRGLGRSTRSDGRVDNSPTVQADDVHVLIHEPPLIPVLDDSAAAERARAAVRDAYEANGPNGGMAAFVAMTSWPGEFADEYFAQPAPDPAAFGMPTDDDGSRDSPLLSDRSWAVSGYRPDVEALAAAPTRVVIAVAEESGSTFTGRTSVATADLLGQRASVFPSHHGGFLGAESGYPGQPEAFALKLRNVLEDD